MSRIYALVGKEVAMAGSGRLSEIKRMSIRGYLARMGVYPKVDKGGYGMYLSPLREERSASFKVDWNTNLWHDFGTGEGGSIIDLVARLENCSIGEAIERLEKSANVVERTTYQKNISNKSGIEIISVSELSHFALMDYLQSRSIDLATAKKYCHELNYRVYDNEYFAIGFGNDAGGWELRSKNFKGSSAPKNITTINNGSDTVMVFEGFLDFLSYLSLKRNSSPTIDTTVLNSVNNLTKAVPFLQSHRTVHAFLDNDDSGRNTVAKMKGLLRDSTVVDQSAFYRNHKDLNDYLQGQRRAKFQPQAPVKKKNKGVKL